MKMTKNADAFAGVGPVRAALLRRLEAAGYFSVANAPLRDLEVDCYSIMTVKQCREHVREVERLAAQYRRTPPRSVNTAVKQGFAVEGITSAWPTCETAKATNGLALIQEKTGLQREFVVPLIIRYAFGKPRLVSRAERREF